MLISIVTPTFNSRETVLDTLKSVHGQSFSNIEHIIVDGVSKDDTLELVKEFFESRPGINYKIICEKDQGIADAFNKGIREASGDIIGVLNSDDYYYHDDVLNEVYQAFQNESLDFVHGKIFFEDDVFGSNIRNPLMCSPLLALPYNHPSMYFKKKVYDEVGLFDISFRFSMDYEWVLRLYDKNLNLKYRGHYLDTKPMVFMRAGGASWSGDDKGVVERRLGLEKHNLYGLKAKILISWQVLKLKVRNFLYRIKLDPLIKFWRWLKWN